jgi:hypothetical protein
MKSTGRFVALALALTLALAACTGGDDDGKGGGKPSGNTGGEPPTGSVSGPSGTGIYRYVNAGLTATLDLEAGTLEIVNETGRDLPEPDFYVLDARDGAQTDGKVEASTDVSAGETKTFDVTLNGIAVKDIGLAVLLMGRDNYGAFVPQ